MSKDTLIEKLEAERRPSNTMIDNVHNAVLDACIDLVRQHTGSQPTDDATGALRMLRGETPAARQAFMVNWLRGTLVIPEEVQLRIWLVENGKRGLLPSILNPESPGQHNGWMDISSAPKDGTKIVATSNRAIDEPWIVSWRKFPPGSYCDGSWQIQALPGRDPVSTLDATHWMPLPPSPEPPKQG